MDCKYMDTEYLRLQYQELSVRVNYLTRKLKTANADDSVAIHAQVSALTIKMMSLKQRIDDFKPSLGIREGSIIQ